MKFCFELNFLMYIHHILQNIVSVRNETEKFNATTNEELVFFWEQLLAYLLLYSKLWYITIRLGNERNCSNNSELSLITKLSVSCCTCMHVICICTFDSKILRDNTTNALLIYSVACSRKRVRLVLDCRCTCGSTIRYF